jgi:peptidylprolyl isomerase
MTRPAFDLLVLAAGAVLLAAQAWPHLRGYFARLGGGTPPRPKRRAAPTPALERRGAREGDTVRVEFVEWGPNGEVFHTSVGGPGLEFTIGAREVIAGLDRAVVGMRPGETRCVVLPPELAHGERNEALVCEVPAARLPAGPVEVGMELTLAGHDVVFTLAEMRGERVVLDANHPLAGRAVTFDVTLLEIVDRGGADSAGIPPSPYHV